MDQLLDWFGRERYEQDLERVRRFWAGEGRLLVSVQTAKHAYRQNFDDEAVADLAVRQLREQAALPGVNLPAFFADFGTVTTAMYWGGARRFPEGGGCAYIAPVARTLDEALALEPRPVDDPALDAARGLRLYDRVRKRLGTDALWLRTPDMQGVLNTAGLVMNQEELLVAMYTDPAKVHALLGKVCDFLVEYALYLRWGAGGRVCGNIWPYTFFPSDLGVSFTEDLMPLLSADLYREFGVPYLQRMQTALGALHIHCCGAWGRHAAALRGAGLDIRAMEFHYPDTTLEELAPLADTTVFIPYLLVDRQRRFRSLAEYYRYLVEEADPRFRFWFACPDDAPEFLEFAARHGG